MRWTITREDAGRSVKDYLRDKHAFSRRLLKSIRDDGGSIDVNSDIHYPWYILQAGDIVNVSFPPEKVARHMQANPMPLSIVYEDEHVLVVDKQAGMATIPSRNHPTHTLANGILAYYREKGITSTVHVVTRLDRNTSGLVLIAKNRYCHALFGRMQKSHQIIRKYIAIVKGEPYEKKGTIEAPIGRKEGSIIERTVTSNGQEAITEYNVLYTNDNYAFVEIKPKTGRTHQIRVHMTHIGHPLVGDDLYSEADAYIDRHALHCHQITFQHPLTVDELTIEAQVSADMKVFY